MTRMIPGNRLSGDAPPTLQGWIEPTSPQAASPPIHALVTGASGFVGMHLAEQLLKQGKRVRLFVRRPEAVRELEQLGADVAVGSLDNVEALSQATEGVETVYHLAAMTSALSVDELMRTNGEGTRNVARACAAQQQKPLLVYVSSVAAAGPCSRFNLRVETDAPAPISNYGRSKLAGEYAAASFAGDLPITIVRPGIVFGPRNREMLPIFRTIKYAGVHVVPGLRPPLLSLMHIDDVLDVVLKAAQHGTRLPAPQGDPNHQLTSGRGVYFAAAPEYPDYAELGRIARGKLRRPHAPVLPLLGPLPWVAASLNERIAHLRGKADTFNLDKIREASAESWACSGERAERELGSRPAAPLHERLEATLDWYQAKGWL
jgi:dihydroflavonol-4-reductase